jgi:hypothetical protein
MTNHTAQPVQHGALAGAESGHHIVRKVAGIALIVVVAAALAAAWLALFMLLPLDFSTLRPN